MEFQCQRCNYRFEAKHKPPSCPYCGEIGNLRPIPSAQELLEEESEESA